MFPALLASRVRCALLAGTVLAVASPGVADASTAPQRLKGRSTVVLRTGYVSVAASAATVNARAIGCGQARIVLDRGSAKLAPIAVRSRVWKRYSARVTRRALTASASAWRTRPASGVLPRGCVVEFQHAVALSTATTPVMPRTIVPSTTTTVKPSLAASTTSSSAGAQGQGQRSTPAGTRYIGAAVRDWMLRDSSYKSSFTGNFTSMTPENELKMVRTQPTQDGYDFSESDDMVAFAQEHAMRVRGHTLVWHDALPAWLTNGRWTRASLIAVMTDRIRTLMTRYEGQIDVWDVVNEPLASNGNLRDTIWSRVIGPDYIAIALRAAHAADPSAKLAINEFGIQTAGPKLTGMLKLVSSLKAAGVPLDEVGSQMHLAEGKTYSSADLAQGLQRVANLGVSVEVTELDVPLDTSASSQAEALAAQAATYSAVGTSCRMVAACVGVTTWGFTDGMTWLPGEDPLPFDANYVPKPAWGALLHGLK